MTLDHSAAMDVLEKALRLEQEGHRFYLEAAERTADPRGSEMFSSLAGDELLHQRIIQRQIDSLSQGGGWVASKEIEDLEAVSQESGGAGVDLDTPLFPRGRLELQKAIHPEASDLEAVLFGLKIENDSFALYTQQAKAAQDPEAKRMYEFLAGAERSHFDLLMLNYESLSGMGFWTA
jgi:rubrerythrin